MIPRKRKLRSYTIRMRLIMLVALGCIFSVTVFTLFSMQNIKESIHHTVESSYSLGLKTAGKRLEDAFVEMHRKAAELTCTGGLITEVEQAVFSRSISQHSSIKKTVERQLILTDFSSSIIGCIVYYYSCSSEKDEVILSNYWLKNFDTENKEILFHTTPYTVFNKPHTSVVSDNMVLSLTRYATSVADTKEIHLYLESDVDFLNSLFITLTDRNNIQLPVYLTDKYGSIIYSCGGTTNSIGLSFSSLQGDWEAFEYPTNDWSLHICVPKADLNALYRSVYNSFFLLFTIFIIVYVILAYLIYHAAYKPLDDFIKELSESASSDIYRKSARVSQEFDEYYMRIDKMRNEICSLLSRAERDSRQNAYLENQLLLSRINPHFLHNTLGSLSIQAKESGQKSLSEIIDSLNSLLYHNLGKNKKTTLKDEIKAVDDYIILCERIHPLKYIKEINISNDMLSIQIPAFTLQPIVENCVIHGKNDALVIKIHVYTNNDTLYIDISDNGKGMELSKQEKINKGFLTGSSQGMGIGLGYVSSAFKYHYASNASVTVSDATNNEGTKIRIAINLSTNKGEESVSSTNC